MNCILVPCHALDISLLDRLADSIDYPVKYKVVVNNNPNEHALDEWHTRHPDWEVLHYGRNLGVAGTWNKALDVFPKTENAFLIINDDHQLQPGCLKQICDASDKHHKDYPILYMNEHRGFDMFCWTRKGYEELGTFDENFFPIYLEDWEYRLRINLAGSEGYIIGTYETLPIVHGKPYTGGKRYRKFLDTIDIPNRDYYRRKWGVIDDKSSPFTNPFNNPDLPITYWRLEEEMRKKLHDFWIEFVSVHDPLRSNEEMPDLIF